MKSTTVGGCKLWLKADDGKVTITDENGGTANVTIADVVQSQRRDPRHRQGAAAQDVTIGYAARIVSRGLPAGHMHLRCRRPARTLVCTSKRPAPPSLSPSVRGYQSEEVMRLIAVVHSCLAAPPSPRIGAAPFALRPMPRSPRPAPPRAPSR